MESWQSPPTPPLKTTVPGAENRLLCNDIILYCLHLSLVKEELDAWRDVSCIFLKLPCVSVENCLVCVSLGFFPKDPLSVEEGWVYRLLASY